jgi:ribonuclease HII
MEQEQEQEQEQNLIAKENMMTIPEKKRKKRIPRLPLPMFYNNEKYQYEIGIDEAGRGPLFGRLYVAGVVLPKDGSMNTSDIFDSKKMSKRTIHSIYDYIMEHSLAYHITYIEASEIDEINIREAVIKAMHTCAREIIKKLELKINLQNDSVDKEKETIAKEKYFLMIDGNDFPPYYHSFSENGPPTRISYETICQGDNSYANIAAASILAKVSRDNYIRDLCKRHPLLVSLYSMNEHMGYGTKKHLEAIKTFGITQYHRKTYGSCKIAPFNFIQ